MKPVAGEAGPRARAEQRRRQRWRSRSRWCRQRARPPVPGRRAPARGRGTVEGQWRDLRGTAQRLHRDRGGLWKDRRRTTEGRGGTVRDHRGTTEGQRKRTWKDNAQAPPGARPWSGSLGERGYSRKPPLWRPGHCHSRYAGMRRGRKGDSHPCPYRAGNQVTCRYFRRYRGAAAARDRADTKTLLSPRSRHLPRPFPNRL